MPDVISLKNQRDNTISANKTSQKALRKVRAVIIDTRKDAGTGANGITAGGGAPGASEAVPDDPFSGLGHTGRVVIPPFDMLTLAMLPENSSELGQCIEALKTNIDATGHRFVSRLRMNGMARTTSTSGEAQAKDTDQSRHLEKEALKEKVHLTNFFTYATSESFINFRKRLRGDLETTGNGYFEIVRNSNGDIQGFTHLPSYQMRLGKLEEDQIEVERKIIELQVDGSVKIKKQRVVRRFRSYVMSRTVHHGHATSNVIGHKIVWFKEFGDPRHYDKFDGKPRKTVKKGKRASEVIHLKLYSPRSPYGLPRFIGNLLSIFGDRAAEEINWVTFKNNNIPSMVFAVSNGQLSQGSIERMESFVESQIQGSDNRSKFLIIEAEASTDEEGEDGGQVRIDITPLTKEQHNDALFQKYSENNQDKIRRAFRLPPLFVGQTKDMNRATADSSRRLADEQVFKPERDEFDEVMNRILFPEMDIVYHSFRSNSPNTTDNQQLVKILGGAEKTGGVTPRIARGIVEDILGIDLPDFPADFPADLPFSLTMAEAVKNQADPTEPGQQVTALKQLLGDDDSGDGISDLLDIDTSDFDPDDPDSVIDLAKRLLRVNEAVEKSWILSQVDDLE